MGIESDIKQLRARLDTLEKIVKAQSDIIVPELDEWYFVKLKWGNASIGEVSLCKYTFRKFYYGEYEDIEGTTDELGFFEVNYHQFLSNSDCISIQEDSTEVDYKFLKRVNLTDTDSILKQAAQIFHEYPFTKDTQRYLEYKGFSGTDILKLWEEAKDKQFVEAYHLLLKHTNFTEDEANNFIDEFSKRKTWDGIVSTLRNYGQLPVIIKEELRERSLKAND